MPNQLNFPDRIASPYVGVRPERISNIDRNLIYPDTKQVVFGISDRDHAEIWVYDTNGSIAGHTNLFSTDDGLSLTTLVDNTGAYEMLNVDMNTTFKIMNIEAGRYGLSINFFRNEVGSELGNKLFISEISNDRTELRLVLKNTSEADIRELYEWVVPSVPKLEAQGLLDQLFGKSEDNDEINKMTPAKVLVDLNQLVEDTSDRLYTSFTQNQYSAMINSMMEQVHELTLEKMADDITNTNVQNYDIEVYLQQAIHEVITEMIDKGQIDPRFEVY